MTATGEYFPLDLSAYRNVEAALVGQGDALPLGDQVFHGLPFQIGDSGAAFVGFGSGLHEQSVVIPIQPQALSVVVAHRVVQSRIMSGW